jgi:hypothetical protein
VVLARHLAHDLALAGGQAEQAAAVLERDDLIGGAVHDQERLGQGADGGLGHRVEPSQRVARLQVEEQARVPGQVRLHVIDHGARRGRRRHQDHRRGVAARSDHDRRTGAERVAHDHERAGRPRLHRVEHDQAVAAEAVEAGLAAGEAVAAIVDAGDIGAQTVGQRVKLDRVADHALRVPVEVEQGEALVRHVQQPATEDRAVAGLHL